MKILIVTTNTEFINKTIPTGVWYEEFAIPFLEFKKQGFEITVASPNGGKTPIDPKSLVNETSEVTDVLNKTSILGDIIAYDYDGLFIPGGHGCMFDLAQNQNLASTIEVLKHLRKVISAVCHGVCGLINAVEKDGSPYVKGKALTGFSDAEEKLTGLESYMPFLLEDKLKSLGANYICQKPWSNFTVDDDYLITGQNQNSVKELTQKFIRKLYR